MISSGTKNVGRGTSTKPYTRSACISTQNTQILKMQPTTVVINVNGDKAVLKVMLGTHFQSVHTTAVKYLHDWQILMKGLKNWTFNNS